MALVVNGETPLRVLYTENGVTKGYADRVAYGGTVIWPLATNPFLCTAPGTYYFPTSSLNFTAVGGGGGGGTRVGSTGHMVSGGNTTVTSNGVTHTAFGGQSGNGRTGAGGTGGSPSGRNGGARGSSAGGNGANGWTLGGSSGSGGGDGYARWDNYSNAGGRGTLTKSSSGGTGYGAGGGGYGKSRILFSGGQFPSLDTLAGAGGGGSGGYKTGTLTDSSGVVTVTVGVGSGGPAGSTTPGVNGGRGANGAVYFSW